MEGATVMETFITSVGSVLTALIGWMGDILDWVMQSPALFIPLLVFAIISFAVGVLMRVIRG